MPSTMAASTTCPSPLRRDSRRAARMPMTRYVEPPPKSPTRLAGKFGLRLLLAHAEQGAGDGDVVHVVPGGLRERTVLAPPGHPAVDQARVAGQALVGSEAEALGGAGAHALDEHVSLGDQVEHRRDRLGVLQVQRDAGPPAVEQVVRAAGEHLPTGPLDPDHVGPEVGQDHAGVRARPDARDLDDLDAPEWSGALTECVRHTGHPDSRSVSVGSGPSRFARLRTPGNACARCNAVLRTLSAAYTTCSASITPRYSGLGRILLQRVRRARWRWPPHPRGHPP